MKTLCKVVNVLCLILSILGFGVAVVFIITDKTGDVGFLNDITKFDLWTTAIWLLTTTVFYTTLLFNKNKGICVCGIFSCLLFSFQSYGSALGIGLGFMITVIYISYIEDKERKEDTKPIVIDGSMTNVDSNVESVQYNNGNYNNTNYSNDNTKIDDDYRPYISSYFIYFVISIILSISYMVLLVMGSISMVQYFSNSKEGVYVLLFALAVPFLGLIAIVLAIDIIYGLVASILALAAPSKSVMLMNSVVGFTSLTFFNALAAISIINYVENVVKNNSSNY